MVRAGRNVGESVPTGCVRHGAPADIRQHDKRTRDRRIGLDVTHDTRHCRLLRLRAERKGEGGEERQIHERSCRAVRQRPRESSATAAFEWP
jgi:hypothetical protein